MAPSSVPVRSCWGIAIHWFHTVFGFHQISSSEVKTHALLFYVNYSFLKLYNLIVFCYSFSSSFIFVPPITLPLAIVLDWLPCPFDVSHTCNFEHLFIRISHWGNLGPVGGRLEVMRVPIISCPVLPGAAALHTSIPSPVPVSRISKLTNYSHSGKIAFCKVILSEHLRLCLLYLWVSPVNILFIFLCSLKLVSVCVKEKVL